MAYQTSRMSGANMMHALVLILSLVCLSEAEVVFKFRNPDQIKQSYTDFRRSEGNAVYSRPDRSRPFKQQLVVGDDHMQYARQSKDPSWNYANRGLDWNFTNCNLTGSTSKDRPQSPLNMTNVTETGLTYSDWQASQFSFIPNYKPVNIDLETKEINYTHTIFLEQPDEFHGVYATEP